MRPRPIHSPQIKNMREILPDVYQELTKPYPSIKLDDWPSFNEMVGGFRSREFSILCGSTGSGKTTFLANVSAQLLKQDVRHFVMSVETGHNDFMKRVMSVLEGRDINTGNPVHIKELSDVTMKNLDQLQKDAIEFSLYDNRVPLEQLLFDLEHAVDELGCEVAMIDNLNFFMEVVSQNQLIAEMDRVVHEIIMFCKRKDIHIIMVMHPKKTTDTVVLSEFDIKGSSTAVQEAHNVFLFNRPKREEVENGGRDRFERDLKIAKLRRRGAYAGSTITFTCKGTRYMEREEINTRRIPKPVRDIGL